MYESHFGFTSRPFAAAPDAGCFFPSENTRRAFESIVTCVERASGAALIVGGSGLGKSTLLLAIADRFQKEYSVACLESASLDSRKELLQNILFELGLPFHGMEEGELRLTLMDYLKPGDRCRNGLLLCVDEAHLLSAKLLEEMRLITNLVRDGQPRARLVLAGNSSIENRLAEPQLDSLSQRISTRAYLNALNSTETHKYISDCLEAVGKRLEDIFDEDAVQAVFVATHGIPRLINQVCDHALVLAVANGQTIVSQQLINEAWSDIQRLPVDWNVLGSQPATTSESVVEFGELESDSGNEIHTPDESVHEESVVLSFESTDDPTADTEPLTNPEDGVIDSTSVTQAEQNEPATEDTVAKEREFNGPSNPFEQESFEEEERVVDRFSQVIGHTPSKPNFPTPESESPNTESPVDDVQRTAIEQSNRQAIESVEGFDVDHSDPIPSEPYPQTLQQYDDGTDTNAPIDTDSLSSTDSLSRSDSEQSLDEYLANTREAITFGVGQGIYADQFKTLEGETQNEEPIEETKSGSDESSAERDALTDTVSIGDRPRNPGSININDTIPLSVSRVDLSCDSNESEETESANPATEDSNDSGGVADRSSVEQEISQVVSELQTEVDDAVQANTEPETQPQGASDDRDMIVVEKEDEATGGNSEEADTVPLSEKESETSSQVKREDYKQLFDRLRNG